MVVAGRALMLFKIVPSYERLAVALNALETQELRGHFHLTSTHKPHQRPWLQYTAGMKERYGSPFFLHRDFPIIFASL